MPKPSDYTAAVRVIEDENQVDLIRKRRKLRDAMLKQVGQRTSIAERNLERLVQLTR